MEPDAMQDNREIILQEADKLRWEIGDTLHDTLIENIYDDATKIAGKTVTKKDEKPRLNWEKTLDKILTSPWTGFPIMIAMLMVVFWITIAGANIPSAMLASLLLETVHPLLKSGAAAMAIPWWLDGFILDGMYMAVAWVISVMLPPMAIFFPLFTLLEDFGYLPRVAFNLDSLFRKSGAHGKQALTMAMGFGCNAAGVIATRVIDSPRERLIAMITNNFSLCNGRWPTQILIAALFIGSMVPAIYASFVTTMAVVTIAVLGIFFMFLTSWGLSRTALKGTASSFSLELPPYRPPRIISTLYTSLIDRTIFVLWRAIIFALPAGAVIWLLANITISNVSLAEYIINYSEPFGLLLGLNGVILLAYIIAIPANEIVIPTILMLTVLSAGLSGVGEGTGVMFELENYGDYMEVFQAGGWTLLTAVNLMLFSLLHNPCSTTIYTIYKESGSMKWTMVATFLPIAMGLILCFFVAQFWRLFTGTG
jgi:ferrous iron transport protein B